ncbi:unannotated protein [freshwater metagenome]|uniref:Unannotated protein n=1 Tax=freshwater metagenome TaxID=449393 RepID=A0A6J6WBR9_9ZZZZ
MSVGDFELDVAALVEFIGVDTGLSEFVTRKSRTATRAVGHDLEVLVEQFFVEELLQLPPDRFDVTGVIGPVGRFQIDPVTNTLGELFKLPDVGMNALATEARELGNTDFFFNGLLARDPEALFDFDLYRQPVGVPAGTTLDKVALHCLVSAEKVLIDTGPDVVQSRLAVGRWGTLVKDPRGRPFALLHRAGEDIVLTPTDELGFFERDEIDLSTDWTEHKSPLSAPIVEDDGALAVSS